MVASTSRTLLIRRSGRLGCGIRMHTLPEAFATSIAATRSITSSCSSSRTISGSLFNSFVLQPIQHSPRAGCPGASVEGTEILTGVLEATVRDPSRSRPRHQAHRRAHIPRGSRRRRATRPYFHACEASPEGQGAHSACLHGFGGDPLPDVETAAEAAVGHPQHRLVSPLSHPKSQPWAEHDTKPRGLEPLTLTLPV